ncbi:STAS domain-containing protein [Cellulomonas sp. ATA003]|uniref:STAS domain-containing protein n=1 Tax=Cellulomonas sp. ATA003 TaxID=3073064 RepID=UPI002873F2BB|nr:STAS domain-containing protein [Cellulomonas sp. ATA003]WNB84361.1 STAS domain-containing protein [Cellulomonas sp. ATA003]
MAADTRAEPPSASFVVDAGGRGAPHGGVEVRRGDAGTHVRLWGSVDLAVRASGTATLGELRGDPSPMTIDCRDVEFMDSTGLSVLVRLVRDGAADGRPMTFLGAPDMVLQLLRTTGVDAWMTELGVVGVPVEG